MHRTGTKLLIISTWVAITTAALYFYFFRRDQVQGEIQSVLSTSVVLASVLYVILGSLRAFTLIPSTYLIVAALPLFPPMLLFVLTLIGILVSSSIIYFCAEWLKLDESFERGRHAARVARVKAILEKHELPIIVGWSFFPLAPTDVICYVCGVLEVNFPKFLFGILLGEGAICAVYIFAGDSALRFLEIK